MDPIYVIWLNSRPDRRQILTKELRQHELLDQTIFIEAETPNSPEVQRLGGGQNIDTIRAHGATFRNELACLASHLKALKLIVKSGVPGLLLEDDAILHKEFLSRWLEIKTQITDHELIYLGCNDSRFAGSYETKLLERKSIVWGTVSYWVTPKRAEKMIQVYSQPMTKLDMRTSELISIIGPTHQVSPLLVIEDPLSFSAMRSEEWSGLVSYQDWGLDNYGGDYRNSQNINEMPFTMLIKKLKETQDINYLPHIAFYCKQVKYREIASRFGITVQ